MITYNIDDVFLTDLSDLLVRQAVCRRVNRL